MQRAYSSLQSADNLRSELAIWIPGQNALQAKILSYPQIVFLLAVARLEAFRAELGNPAVMLDYFHNEGVNNGALAGPLVEISQKVGALPDLSLPSCIKSFRSRSRKYSPHHSVNGSADML